MAYFKVLPTDPRFQALNIFQKLLLLSVINESDKEKYDLISIGLERLGMAAAPMGFGGVVAASSGAEARDGEHHNAEFERHHRSAQETGVPDVSVSMRNAIKSMYTKKDPANVLKLSGPIPKEETDPNVLG